MAAHYDIFRHHLVSKYPAYGHALWEPDPGNLYPAVKVGDVGYIREGKFRRLFNVFLPAEDESHEDFGVPEYHEPLTLSVRKHIDIGKLGPHNFCSSKVTSMPASEQQVNGPDEIPKVTFYCPRKEGAVLCLPVHAKAENTVASEDFGKCIIRHVDRWFAWARQLGLGVDRMEDIILVTGAHCTRSCTNVAFPGGQGDAQVSFGAKVDHSGDTVSINWQFSHERNRGVMLNYGPEGKDLPEDQCIFIRGFRVTRKLKILPPRLKGAAGPNPDPEGDEEEPDAELMPIPALPKYRDPLLLLLEYVTEEAPPNCDMVLVHDDDLAQLDGIWNNSKGDLQSDVLLSHFRSLKPTLHNARIDLNSTHSIVSERDSVWVTTLSNIFRQQSPSSTLQSLSQSLRTGTPSPWAEFFYRPHPRPRTLSLPSSRPRHRPRPHSRSCSRSRSGSISISRPCSASGTSPISGTPGAGGSSPGDIGADPAQDTAAKQALIAANEKRRRRRESYIAVERRRRDNINEKISELATLIPECILNPAASTQTLTSPTPEDIFLGNLIPEGTAAQAAAGEDSGKREGAGDRVVKANKGMILRKSVEYIRYLQQLVMAQASRNRELEAEIGALRSSEASPRRLSSHHHDPTDSMEMEM